MKAHLRARVAGEFLGSTFLVAAVVGWGIMGVRLAGGNAALALLANTIATGAALVALILTFGPISGAHLNPVVSIADALERGLSRGEALVYIAAQISGGVCGTIAAHVMFGLAMITPSRNIRSGLARLLSEAMATFGLLCVIWGCARARSNAVAFAVGCYITAAYWFTASTSFADPAVTIARSLSDTFAGIRPADVPMFVVAQLGGGIAATMVFRWLVPTLPERAKEIVVARREEEGRRDGHRLGSGQAGVPEPFAEGWSFPQAVSVPVTRTTRNGLYKTVDQPALN